MHTYHHGWVVDSQGEDGLENENKEVRLQIVSAFALLHPSLPHCCIPIVFLLVPRLDMGCKSNAPESHTNVTEDASLINWLSREEPLAHDDCIGNDKTDSPHHINIRIILFSLTPCP
jgi:hypothetical protein